MTSIALMAVFATTCFATTAGSEIASEWTTVGDVKVHYLSAGKAAAPVVVMLHGGRFRATTWQDTGTIEVLADKGFRVIAVDLPGYGESPRSSVKRGEWLVMFLDALKLDKPVVVSPSMSGGFSMPLVTTRPERLGGFVAVAPVSIKRHEDVLEKITIPVLAIWGENDKVVPLAHANLLVKKAPYARKVVVEKAGHALYMDDAKAYHRALIEFLAQFEE